MEFRRCSENCKIHNPPDTQNNPPDTQNTDLGGHLSPTPTPTQPDSSVNTDKLSDTQKTPCATPTQPDSLSVNTVEMSDTQKTEDLSATPTNDNHFVKPDVPLDETELLKERKRRESLFKNLAPICQFILKMEGRW